MVQIGISPSMSWIFISTVTMCKNRCIDCGGIISVTEGNHCNHRRKCEEILQKLKEIPVDTATFMEV